ncbi:MAG: SDR family oxidoreductase [Bacteroidota bacterium]
MTLTILGATSDIAQALAHRFAPAVSKMILSTRQNGRLDAFQKDLQIRYPNLTLQIEPLDVFDPQQERWEHLATQTNLLICAIGYLGDHGQAQQNPAEANRIIGANYSGLVPILNTFAADMEKRGEGGIIAISSVAGERGRQSNYLYGSAKAGLTAYLSGLRNWLYAKNVHVMTVLPGFVDTRMTAHLELPPLLTSRPDQLADLVHRAWQKRKNVLYVMPRWRWIMWVIRNIPEWIFKRLKL